MANSNLAFAYRKLDANADYVIGSGADFYVNEPAAVGQAIRTRLLLFTNEFFINLNDGTAWQDGVLGKQSVGSYDQLLKERIINTPGVTQIRSYSSTVDAASRTLTVNASVSTIYGSLVSIAIPLSPGGAFCAAQTTVPSANSTALSFAYRALDANGDYTIGTSQNFLINSPAAVAQSVLTRLKLWVSQWYLSNQDGTPWLQSILGKGTSASQYDALIKLRIIETTGVTQITSYLSSVTGRSLSVNVNIQTMFGPTTIQVIL